MSKEYFEGYKQAKDEQTVLLDKLRHKLDVLLGQVEKVKRFGGDVSKVEGKIQGIKYALRIFS